MSSDPSDMFCGDADGYMERLAKSCEQRQVASPPSGYGRELVPFFSDEEVEVASPPSGYGRELVPFFSDEEVELLCGVQPLEAPAGSKVKGFKRYNSTDVQSGFKRYSAPAKPSSPASKPCKTVTGSPAKSSGKATCKSAGKSSGRRSRRGSSGSSVDLGLPSQRNPSPSQSAPRTAVTLPKNAEMCGPGFQMSPKPEVLPMPTSALLKRAFARTDLLLDIPAYSLNNFVCHPGRQVAAY